MSMIDHVTIRVGDLAEAMVFYDRVFNLLGFTGQCYEAEPFFEWGDFSLAQADPQHPPTTGLHLAFTADSQELVESWWLDLTDAGHRSDGEPGLRPQYSPDYYGAFILDSHGNSVEAVTHARAREQETGSIDHLWIRVEDLIPVKRFYAAIAPVVELTLHERADRFGLEGERGSFTFTEGRPTQGLHLALGLDDQQAVQRFHQAALATGARNNGEPGERPQYHPGYYGAYVIDPADTNLEAVFHDRSMTSMSASS
jgi:catechol 2,3-dioxygenase-like lactoylglutathione lyase family enzyme